MENFAVGINLFRQNNKKACRIPFSQPVEGYNQDNWPQMFAWLELHVGKLETVLAQHLKDLKQVIKG